MTSLRTLWTFLAAKTIDGDSWLTDREGRPILVLEDGQPVPELF